MFLIQYAILYLQFLSLMETLSLNLSRIFENHWRFLMDLVKTFEDPTIIFKS